MSDAPLPAPAPAPPPEPTPPVPSTPPAAAPASDPPGRRYALWNLGALGVAAVAFAIAFSVKPKPASAGDPSTNAFLDRTWNDGQAEVARYDAERVIYGKPRSYELVQITVKEAFDPATRTKPDTSRAGIVDAIKLGRIEDAPSGRAYRYRQTLTLRIDRDEPARLLDAAMGSQEWCGNTFAVVARRGGTLVREVHSYFDGEGDRTDTIGDAWLEDQLFVTLRALPLAVGWEKEVPLLPSIVSNRQPATRPSSAKIKVEADESVATPAGNFPCARVRAERAGGSLVLWFAREGTRPLVRYEGSDGKKGLLRSVERTVYWKD